MRVVVITGFLPREMGHLKLLAGSIEVVVYGVEGPGVDRESSTAGLAFRTLQPMRLSGEGHLRWIYRGLSDALDAHRPDVVHLISEPWGSLAVQLATWARRTRFRGLVLHGCDQQWRLPRRKPDPKRMPRLALARYSLTAASGFAGENTGAIREAMAGGLRADAPTAVIHTNPRDPSLFCPARDETERIEARRSLSLPEQGVGVGLMGRLVPEKGSGLFMDAWSTVTRSIGGWAAIAGGGPLEAELRRRAPGTMRVLGSLRFPDEVVGFFKSVDVFVHPPWSTTWWAEQAPRALIEAMMSGCLVVASDSGANAEVLGGTGMLVPEADPAALAAAVEEAIRLAEEGRGDLTARTRAVEEFSLEPTAEKLFDLWRRVAGRS